VLIIKTGFRCDELGHLNPDAIYAELVYGRLRFWCSAYVYGMLLRFVDGFVYRSKEGRGLG
jgi:hypothetical protein